MTAGGDKMICRRLPADIREKIVVTFGGESLIKEYDLYGYRRGVREKVCYHLRWGKSL